MRKTTITQALLAGVAILALAVAPASALTAQTEPTEVQQPAQGQEQSQSTQAAQAQQREQQRAELQSQRQERKETNEARLDAAKLQVCQRREKHIQNIMSRIADRGNRQLEVFTTISDRVQAFYVSKGNVLSNYDELVANVAAKKTAAQAAVDTVKNTDVTFKCDNPDPKAVPQAFQGNVKTMNAALKDYKTAVKDLIVGVKSVQSTTTESSNAAGGQQ